MRIVNRVVAAVIALALLLGGLLVAIEIFLAGIGQGPWLIPYDEWYANARANPWSFTPHRWLFIVLCLAGLALLVLQFVRRAPRTLPLGATGTSGVETDITRTSVQKSLSRAAEQVDGIAGAKVRLSETHARVLATSNRRTPGDLQERVREAVGQKLSSLGLARPPRLSVAVRHREAS